MKYTDLEFEGPCPQPGCTGRLLIRCCDNGATGSPCLRCSLESVLKCSVCCAEGEEIVENLPETRKASVDEALRAMKQAQMEGIAKMRAVTSREAYAQARRVLRGEVGKPVKKK